jgi:fused signal recognition particle receptor
MNLFASKLKNFFGIKQALSKEIFEDLTDLLVEGDFGAQGAYALAKKLEETCKKKKVEDGEGAKLLLAELLEEILLKAPPKLPAIKEGGLAVFLLLGINGVGKTTTAAKLAHFYRDNYQRRTILAAADTFRAAATEQLKTHGERLGLRVIAHQHGGDPAAVIYDAIEAAKAGGGDLVIADTAGRMHTKSALVEELRKINRVVELKTDQQKAGGRYIKYLVLDATTGRNALAQAEIFCEAVSPESVILAKYDSTAKGGVVFSLASGLKLPVSYICNGEKYTDIHDFNTNKFVREFAGLN